MIKVRLVCVGKLKERYLRDGCAEYVKRLSRYCQFETVELPERATLAEEGEDILRAARGHLFVLTPEGRSMHSEAFAQRVKEQVDCGREMTFVVGSSHGLCDAVKAAGEKISFSMMTMPHQLFRLVLTEQIYRAFTILAGAEYHK